MTDVPLPPQGSPDWYGWAGEQEDLSDKARLIVPATDTVAGLVELATNAEAVAGTDAVRAVTPAALRAATSVIAQTTQTGTAYTFVAADAGTLVEGNNAGAITWTVPANVFPTGAQVVGRQYGAGQITVAAATGVVLRSRGGALRTVGQFSEFTLTHRGGNEFVLSGDLMA